MAGDKKKRTVKRVRNERLTKSGSKKVKTTRKRGARAARKRLAARY